MWAAAELIEAASRTGQAWLAAGALTGLSEARASARPTGGRESMPAAGPCSATARTPRPVIVRRSIGSAEPAFVSNSPARTCCTASGCVASTGGPRRGRSCALRMTCSLRSACRPSRSGPAASCWPPARPPARAPQARATSSARNRTRLPGRPGRACPTPRSSPADLVRAHRRMAPGQGFHQAPDQLPPATPASAARWRQRRADGIIPELDLGAGPGPAGRPGYRPGCLRGRDWRARTALGAISARVV